MKKREESKSSEWNFTADLTKFKEVRKSSTERKKKTDFLIFLQTYYLHFKGSNSEEKELKNNKEQVRKKKKTI